MNEPRDDYLWDRSGTPDPDIERLVRALNPLREDVPGVFEGTAQDREPGAAGSARRPSRMRARWTRWLPLGAAAAAALVLATVWNLRDPSRQAITQRSGPGPEDGSRWSVECLSGSLRIQDQVVKDEALLATGERLATDDNSRARVAVGDIGQIEIEPNSSVRLVGVRGEEHRLALEHGVMRAFIWAPPRQFVVETPSAVATDLGCSYLLAVDERGAGRIEVTSGWVAFEHEGRESFVPADAVCRTEPGVGPGTPHYADAPVVLVKALEAFDFVDLDDGQKHAALRTVLTTARRADAFTLWHLLTRAPADQRGAVFDALAAMVRPPTGVRRDDVARGDRMMLDLWWNSLGLGDADWWRMWEGSAPSAPAAPAAPSVPVAPVSPPGR